MRVKPNRLNLEKAFQLSNLKTSIILKEEI